jgi:hypothetical protein
VRESHAGLQLESCCSRFFSGAAGDPVRDKIAEVNRIISRLEDQMQAFSMNIGREFADEKGAARGSAPRSQS